MIKMEHSVVINRSIEEVFAFLIDVEKWPQWRAEAVEVKKPSEGPVGVGTTFSGVGRFLGRRLENINEVTQCEPNRKFGFKTTSGHVSMQFTDTFESVKGGTKISLVLDGETGGFFKLAEPIMSRMVRRQFKTNYANLKDLLEAQT